MAIKRRDSSWYAGSHLSTGRIRVAAHYLLDAGPKDGTIFGVACMGIGDEAGYFLGVKANGAWGIFKNTGGPGTVLTQSGTNHDARVAAASDWTVTGDCTPTGGGTVLTLTVNGRQLGQATDTDPPKDGDAAGINMSLDAGAVPPARLTVTSVVISVPDLSIGGPSSTCVGREVC